MQLATILTAAKNSMLHGKRSPHCFSCKSDQPDYKPQLARAVQSEIDNLGFASGYAEPGYTDPAKGVLFADWNKFPKNFDRTLERAGYAVEWQDEWSTCGDCGKAVRTLPNSYGWTSAYRIMNECEIVCLDCLDAADYLESIEDDPNHACPPGAKFCPLLHGYTQHNGQFETGFHPGQNDNPKAILAALHAQGKHHVVFRIANKGQFDIRWEAFYKDDCADE